MEPVRAAHELGSDYVLDVDAETWTRWSAEAERRGQPVEQLVHDAVEAALRAGEPWTGVERRRGQQTLLDATGTNAEEH